MESIKLGLLLLSIVYIAECSPRSGKMALVQEHLRLLKQFPCAHPQPRVFELKDLVSKDDWDKKYEEVVNTIQPPVSILHRCYSSGCCESQTERCMPIETEEVTLTFAIAHETYMEYFNVPATNHTQCTCMEGYDSNIK